MIPSSITREGFRALAEAGFEDRLLFGSDQMLWPEAYGAAIEGIGSAEFLTPDRKDAIFYGNAAHLLGMEEGSGP